MGARQVDEETIRRWISEGIGGSPGGSSYLVWAGQLSQTGENDPSVNGVFVNTLGGEVVWTRNFAGVYKATKSGAFPANRVAVFFSGHGSGAPQYRYMMQTSDGNNVYIQTNTLEIDFTLEGYQYTEVDDALNNTLVFIYVLPEQEE